jgi:UDP-N-acetylmuramoyl-L-alanyl-D-glutamate--2,6-diaminopimelate ligase
MLKRLIKKFTPKFALNCYHYCLAVFGCLLYGNPTQDMIVIGITGTSGKSTTVYLLDAILREAGFLVGVSSTVYFRVGHDDWLNAKKMTMPGRWQTFQLLQEMKQAGCKYVIVETTSEGIKQYRHIGINYDLVLFTNLSPEHIESHGSFENYKSAKGKLFKCLNELAIKRIGGKEIKKTIIVNVDDEHAKYFLDFPVQQKIGFGLTGQCSIYNLNKCVEATDVQDNLLKPSFKVEGYDFKINLPGRHNVYNALAAIMVASTLGIKYEISAKALQRISGIPGRFEFIDEGQPFGVIVDFAFEPKQMKTLYNNVDKLDKQKIIQVLGGTGGGRDKARRPVLGQMAAEKCDYVIVTNEDPYDEDPEEIMNQVMAGALAGGKELNKSLFKILDRRKAIKKAIELAGPGDLILITGKGCEQAIVVHDNKKIPWDDRVVAREELIKSNAKCQIPNVQ